MEKDEGGEALGKHQGFQAHDGIHKNYREIFQLGGLFYY
jgi:hypothetical protein